MGWDGAGIGGSYSGVDIGFVELVEFLFFRGVFDCGLWIMGWFSRSWCVFDLTS